MSAYYAVVRNDIYLEHHGIKGQKWGVRRFQNEDGSLTSAGRDRYANFHSSVRGHTVKRVSKAEAKYARAKEKYDQGLKDKKNGLVMAYRGARYRSRGSKLLDAYDQLSAEQNMDRSFAKNKAQDEYDKGSTADKKYIKENRKIESDSSKAAKDTDAKAEKVARELVDRGSNVTITMAKRTSASMATVTEDIVRLALTKEVHVTTNNIVGNKHTVTKTERGKKSRYRDSRYDAWQEKY